MFYLASFSHRLVWVSLLDASHVDFLIRCLPIFVFRNSHNSSFALELMDNFDPSLFKGMFGSDQDMF